MWLFVPGHGPVCLFLPALPTPVCTRTLQINLQRALACAEAKAAAAAAAAAAEFFASEKQALEEQICSYQKQICHLTEQLQTSGRGEGAEGWVGAAIGGRGGEGGDIGGDGGGRTRELQLEIEKLNLEIGRLTGEIERLRTDKSLQVVYTVTMITDNTATMYTVTMI